MSIEKAKRNRKFKIYIVKRGDTLWSISKELGITVNELKELNEVFALQKESSKLISPSANFSIIVSLISSNFVTIFSHHSLSTSLLLTYSPNSQYIFIVSSLKSCFSGTRRHSAPLAIPHQRAINPAPLPITSIILHLS